MKLLFRSSVLSWFRGDFVSSDPKMPSDRYLSRRKCRPSGLWPGTVEPGNLCSNCHCHPLAMLRLASLLRLFRGVPLMRRLDLGFHRAAQQRQNEPRIDFANDREAGSEALDGMGVVTTCELQQRVAISLVTVPTPQVNKPKRRDRHRIEADSVTHPRAHDVLHSGKRLQEYISRPALMLIEQRIGAVSGKDHRSRDDRIHSRAQDILRSVRHGRETLGISNGMFHELRT